MSNRQFLTERMASDVNRPGYKFQKQRNCIFSISVLSEYQKEAFRTPYLKMTAEATDVIRGRPFDILGGGGGGLGYFPKKFPVSGFERKK